MFRLFFLAYKLEFQSCNSVAACWQFGDDSHHSHQPWLTVEHSDGPITSIGLFQCGFQPQLRPLHPRWSLPVMSQWHKPNKINGHFRKRLIRGTYHIFSAYVRGYDRPIEIENFPDNSPYGALTMEFNPTIWKWGRGKEYHDFMGHEGYMFTDLLGNQGCVDMMWNATCFSPMGVQCFDGKNAVENFGSIWTSVPESRIPRNHLFTSHSRKPSLSPGAKSQSWRLSSMD